MLNRHILSALLLILTVNSTTAIAKTQDQTLSVSVFTKLNSIEKLMSQQDYVKAQKKLDKLVNELPKRPTDRAYVLHTQATLFLYQENYKSAQSYYKQSYKLQALNEKTTASIAQILANLALYYGEYQEAVTFLNDYLALNNEPNKQVLVALGTAYYQLQQYTAVESPLRQVVQQFTPDESVYLMLFSSYYELGKLEKAAEVLEDVIRFWPTEAHYWLQLASVYLERKQISKSLEVLQLAFLKRLLPDENGLLQYVYALYEKGLPFKSAHILKQAIERKAVKQNYKNYSLLASLFVDARENDEALKAFIMASEYAEDGKEDLYVAQIYFDRDSWNEAIKHTQKALKKGIQDEGDAYMLLAASYHELDNTKQTKHHLIKASKYKKTRKMALQWLSSLEKG